MDLKNIVDVIGIGAINFDFIFSSSKADDFTGAKNRYDDGEEIFVKEHVFQDELIKVQKHSELIQTQVGGSALLAIRTLKAMCSNLHTSYVGVYGNVPDFAIGKNLPQNNEQLNEFFSSFIDDSTWMFKEEKTFTGCALVKLHKRKRQFINIFTGANDSLSNHIDVNGEARFIDFLAAAKWIHVTSLKSVFQFKNIMYYIKQAKILNPHLKVSIDPGYDYTKNHWKTLKEILHIADFVFLSKSELSNISQNLGLSRKAKVLDLGEELIKCKANPQVIIVKETSHSVLLNLINNKPFIRTYYHKKLSNLNILNDTGAGDAFAGGFIAAMLSPYMLSYQPAPIQLASIAARERLKSIDWPISFKEEANIFFQKNMKNESLNKGQWLKIHFPHIKNYLFGVFTGVVGSIIAGIILDFIFS